MLLNQLLDKVGIKLSSKVKYVPAVKPKLTAKRKADILNKTIMKKQKG
jgi:hypothetical protein